MEQDHFERLAIQLAAFGQRGDFAARGTIEIGDDSFDAIVFVENVGDERHRLQRLRTAGTRFESAFFPFTFLLSTPAIASHRFAGFSFVFLFTF